MSLPPIDPDSYGDIILLVGSGADCSLRVSSKVLSIASSVFAAMLRPNFLEGGERSETNPKSIALPEDDPEAVTWVCHAIHFQDDIEEEISLELIEKIAVFCDKYNCSRALASWSTVWLKRFQLEAIVPEYCLKFAYERLVFVSYAFNNQYAFWLSTKGLVQHGQAGYTTGLPAHIMQGLATLPNDMINGLHQHRESVLEELHLSIERLIIPFMASLYSNGVPTGCHSQTLSSQMPYLNDPTIYPYNPAVQVHGTNHWIPGHSYSGTNQSPPGSPIFSQYGYEFRPCAQSAKIGHYFRELHRLGLWPLKPAFKKCTISNIMNTLAGYQNFQPSNVTRDCKCIDADFHEILQDTCKAAYSRQVGLCLVCAQNGIASFSAGNCCANKRSECQNVELQIQGEKFISNRSKKGKPV